MSKIRAEVEELKSIERELKIMRLKGRTLRERKNNLEQSIADFLKSKQQIGVQDGDSNIVLQEKLKSVHKKEKDRTNDALNVLEKYGIRHADKVLEEILTARKGEQTSVTKIKIQKIKSSN